MREPSAALPRWAAPPFLDRLGRPFEPWRIWNVAAFEKEAVGTWKTVVRHRFEIDPNSPARHGVETKAHDVGWCMSSEELE